MIKRVREIDLASRPVNRLVWFARLSLRSLEIAFWLAVATLRLPFLRLSTGSWSGALGNAVTFLFTRLGATFIKVGQIMSSRPDVFPEAFLEPFPALQDRVAPFPFEDVRRIVEEDFGRPLGEIFAEFREKPVASASVAQVHRAILQDAELPPTFPSKVVAVKVRRPGIVRRAYLDEAILRFGARLLSIVPTFSLISPVEAIRDFCEAVNKQLDFRIEAENNRRFRKNFADDPYFVIPALVDSLSSDRVLTMEFIDGVKEDQVRGLGVDLAFVSRKGMEGIARMIFHHGFIHADLHPGNILFLPGNRIGVLDLGLVGVLTEENRRRFALLLYYVATGLGAEVARWFYQEFDSKRVVDYPAYERDVAALVALVHDRPIEDTQVTAALAKIYDVLRRHRIVAEATFTIANIAMMVVEGIARRLNPKLNVSREVRPYLEAALALSTSIQTTKETPPALDATVPAQIAGGRYRIRRLLGEGVRKRVYLARDIRLDRDVALALLRTEGLDESGLARITLEARAVARLADHPRIVPVYDTGDEGGTPYVVSQYMGGGTLSGKLLRVSEHRLPIDVALRFTDQICQALEYAHGHGVVHRDVKPENIWLTEDGFAKLGDFGLARTLGRPEGSLEGMTVGTALYMPPEQALGRGVDHRSDLYSLGATLYELVTGRPPFEGDTVAEVIASHIHANPEAPSRRNPLVPPGLDALVLRLLAKRPENRFESAAAVREALRDLPAAEAEVTAPEEESDSNAVFVGREQEMQRLRKGLEEAIAGRGRFFCLVGEAGIGKTCAAQLLASYAARRGSVVLTGRSFEGEGAPAFWPWVQILRGYLDGRDSARLETELGPGAVYVAHLVPEIREALPDLPELAAIETEEARFKLFDAVVSFLRRAATTQPLVLFLDDLHWADKPSLLLLQFLTRELGAARIFVVGAYRDVDVQHGHPLADLLPSLRRERAFERILLRGLPEDDVRALVNALAGAGAPEAFVRAIARETEGNPFFIEETIRHLAEEGQISREDGRWTSRVSPDELGLPEGVREVIGRRLARLGEECRRILRTASVLGREFEPRALEEVAGIGAERSAALLGEAIAARIVEEGKQSSRHRFTHALIRETLYAELGAAERVRLHRKIADALERLYVNDVEPHLSELAYHFFEAAPAGDVDRAIEYATLAAERADRQLAYEEAAAFYERAVRAMETMPQFDEGEQCELLVRLGTAQWRSAEHAKSRVTLLRAAELAERSGRAEALARAALVYTGEESVAMLASVGNRTLAPLLERALHALPREDSAARAMVMGHLAGVLTFSEEQERRNALFDEALEMANRLDDKRALVRILAVKLTACWGAEDHATIRSGVETMLRCAEEAGDDRMSAYGRAFQSLVLSEAGDIDGALAAATEADRMVSRIHEPRLYYATSFVRTGAVVASSEPAKAEAAIQKTFEIGGGEYELSFPLFIGQRMLALWQQGRLAEIEEVGRQFFRVPYTEYVVRLFRLILTIFTAETGRIAEARETYETLVPKDLSPIHHDTFRLGYLATVARGAELFGDVERARAVYDLLLPHGDRAVVVGGCMVYGAVGKYLGLAAKALLRFDDAVRHFEKAIWIERQMPFWLAETRCAYAQTLVLRRAPGDRERALSLLGEALEGARAYGAKHVAAKALSLKLELEGIAADSPRSSIDLLTSSIEQKQPDLRPAAAPDGTVTLLFTDMENFSAMTERLGDRRAHEVMREHNRVVRAEAAEHGGVEIDAQGDGFLLAFSSARRGLQCAVAIQKAFAARAEAHPDDEAIRVRMGLHTGEVIRDGKTFFGKTVILAARIAASASGGEILVSSVLRELVGQEAVVPFGRLREVELKGLTGKHGICAVGWDGSEPVEPEPVARTPAQNGNVFRRDGDYWTIAYEGKGLSLRDTKGVKYIARLLAESGRELHALDLVGGEGVQDGSADTGSAGDLLDPQARTEYRRRLADLQGEIEEARGANDIGRVERLQSEIDFLARELSAAFGVGGRARKAGDAAERARKAVYSRISDSITRIRKDHTTLALHLENAIQLGTFCTYRPEKPTRWNL